ncbi:hypothetical protein D3C84_1051180 [compost metagenome]
MLAVRPVSLSSRLWVSQALPSSWRGGGDSVGYGWLAAIAARSALSSGRVAWKRQSLREEMITTPLASVTMSCSGVLPQRVSASSRSTLTTRMPMIRSPSRTGLAKK